MPGSEKKPMETLSQAIRRLEEAGYRAAFRARSDGLLTADGELHHAPEDLVVDEVVRFEGESDPEDQAVLFALRTRDRSLLGTFVATYGTQTDPGSGEAMRRLDVVPDDSRVGES